MYVGTWVYVYATEATATDSGGAEGLGWGRPTWALTLTCEKIGRSMTGRTRDEVGSPMVISR